MTSTEPADRGKLEVAPAVVRKVAQHAADGTPGVRPNRRTLGGLDVGEHRSTARVDGDGDRVDVRVEVAMRYPSSVRDTAAALRRRVSAEIDRITGYRVEGVDVVVSALLSQAPPRPRVE